MNANIEKVLDRWVNRRPRFAKGALIEIDSSPQRPCRTGEEAGVESVCCCAQGDALRTCGVSTDDLWAMLVPEADRKVAKMLGISTFHSILLRKVNDSEAGCPENVLRFSDDGLGKVLGPNWRAAIALGEMVDAIDPLSPELEAIEIRASKSGLVDSGFVRHGSTDSIAYLACESLEDAIDLREPSVQRFAYTIRFDDWRCIMALAMQEIVDDGPRVKQDALKVIGLGAAWVYEQNKRWR